MDARRLPAVALVAALAIAACAVPRRASAQDGRGDLVGVVVDEEGLGPIEGATVEIVGTRVRVATAADGWFNLRNLRPGAVTLRVRAEGYVAMVEDVEVGADEAALLQFRLLPLAAVLNALVVRVRGDGAARGDGGQDVPVKASPTEATALDMLARGVAGVDVRREEGVPGASLAIVIRGVSSVSLSNEPAVYVDGVRVHGTDILQQIPASSVARIRVLRGPASAGMFAQSGNGVILVETRRGDEPERGGA